MIAEDLSLFVKDFGVTVTVTRGAVVLRTIKAIFDDAPFTTAVYDRSFYDEKHYDASVTGSNPVLQCLASDAADLRLNDKATLAGKDYFVATIEPDGTGMCFVNLSLHRIQ